MIGRYKNIARVVSTHGSKGEVVVAALRGLPFLVREGMSVALTPPALKRDRFVAVERVAVNGDDDGRVLFSCARSLDDAESLVGCRVLALASDLDLGAGDVAFDDLIGCEVQDERHGLLGEIVEIMESPAHDIWVVEGPFGEVMIPVVEDVVVDMGSEDGPIRVRIMDGLLDL